METQEYSAQELAQRRAAMEMFFKRTGWSLVVKAAAKSRWGRDVTVNIAEKGVMGYIPVKGWTNTDTGTIFLREDIFDGIDFRDPYTAYTVEATARALTDGVPINKALIQRNVGWMDVDKYWRIAQTIVANYGVLGHEYCHAAYSEHAGRDSWQMGLEDLRAEALWMAQDPIRARQGLRACASFWVTHDTSPMAGEQEFDFSKIKTHASLLHLYLLIVGRGRIGVLDDQSTLVSGVRSLAESVLGWEVVADADDIIDQFLETDERVDNESAAADRKALAQEFADLLPKEAGKPDGGIGCHCDPDSKPEVDKDQQGEAGDGAPSNESGDEPGESGSESGESGKSGESGESGGESGEGESGDESGGESGGGQGDESSNSGGGESDESGESGESGGSDSGDSGESSESSDDEQGAGGSGGDASEGEDGSGEDGTADVPTIGSDKGGDSSGGGDAGDEREADFVTGTYGERIRPADDHASDELSTSDAFRLTDDQVKALAEVLADGLEEVTDSEGEAGWAISDTEGLIITSRATSPTKIFNEVFSRQGLITRNRRLKR